ncbi:MAG TPA: hypothetical protein VMY37_02930, partial [Thermoguttaceae bacterium]|nr:hypothetical protein [Thermoguttaceae bacterium]
MTAITEANAKKLIRAMPFFRQQSRLGLDGWYKWLKNFDDTTGALIVSVDDTITGTNAAAFEVDADGSVPALALGSQAAGSGDYTLTLKPAATLTGNADVLVPDGADTFCMIAATQTLTNKTLTAPTIVAGQWTNAQHTHADAANGGAISTTVSGTTASTFTINQGAAVETEIAITSASTTGGFTATLSVPTLAADRTITFPAVTGTLAILGANTFTGAQTIGTGASISASGTGSVAMSGSTGAFTTTTGTNTLSGHVVIAAAKNLTMSSTATITTGTGAITLNGAVTLATTKGITMGSASAGIAT